jgi:GAF domain-containing protein
MATTAQGPHFADWAALGDAGARSLVTAPLRVQERMRAVLCLASDQPRAFDGCAWAEGTVCTCERTPLCLVALLKCCFRRWS